MKHVMIVPKNRAESVIPRIANANSLCYYLSDDHPHLINLREKLSHRVEIKSLSGIFNEVFQEIKEPFLELMTRLNKRYDSLEWWRGQIASRNTVSTPLVLNITYLFCVKRLLSFSEADFLFIVESKALADCISMVARDVGCNIKVYRYRTTEYSEAVKLRLYYVAQICAFVWRALQSRAGAFRVLRPLTPKNKKGKKRIIIRSWVTKSTFDRDGRFRDRNFGPLAAWLSSKKYEVWTLPMFFNLNIKLSQVYALIKKQELPFIIPDHYLKASDYLGVLYGAYRLLKMRVDNARISNIDVSPIFNEVIDNCEFGTSLDMKNLCYPMLKRLKEQGFEIDGFYYAFENNPPEKGFILGCRRFFPDSKLVGFQHTVFSPSQLAYHLGPGESEFHPLPDKIVCSGPLYVDLHERAGFPREMIVSGPNLRFENVYSFGPSRNRIFSKHEKAVMLPLTTTHDLAFELFSKTKAALGDSIDYKVYVRSHPLLERKKLVAFLNKIGMRGYEFADDGIIQEWFSRLTAVISAGRSITILEAVAAGVPVIRVVPDNTFFYDPFISF